MFVLELSEGTVAALVWLVIVAMVVLCFYVIDCLLDTVGNEGVLYLHSLFRGNYLV
jgi:hypothetical protein